MSALSPRKIPLSATIALNDSDSADRTSSPCDTKALMNGGLGFCVISEKRSLNIVLKSCSTRCCLYVPTVVFERFGCLYKSLITERVASLSLLIETSVLSCAGTGNMVRDFGLDADGIAPR